MSSRTKLTVLFGFALAAVQALTPSPALAVGNGVPFGFREFLIPNAQNNTVPANSLDFTYHDCLEFTTPTTFTERGYLWISSFQDIDSVVDSQINDFQANGYHIYARYNYSGEECASGTTCLNATRRSYTLDQATIQLFLDRDSDTVLGIANCAVTVANNADDVALGISAVLEEGRKTETDEIINGDFELKFDNWVFSAFGQQLFRTPNNMPLAAPVLVVNGNVTGLQGPIDALHHPEGSGNLFWRLD